MQFYVVGIVKESDLSARQLKTMDSYSDGYIDGVDIAYSMKIVALKYRFLTNFTTAGALGTLRLAAAVRDANGPASWAQTRLSFEIGTTSNVDMPFVTGLNASVTDDGVLVYAEMTEAGLFESLSVPRHAEFDIGIVVIIVTYDAKGQTSSDRKVAFYCSRLMEVCV